MGMGETLLLVSYPTATAAPHHPAYHPHRASLLRFADVWENRAVRLCGNETGRKSYPSQVGSGQIRPVAHRPNTRSSSQPCDLQGYRAL